jgi:LEA14-like dessication related protein
MKYFLILLVLLISSACTSYKDVEIKSIERVSGFQLTPGELNIEIKVRVNNPNKYNIKVKDSDLYFYLDDTQLGRAQFTKPIELKSEAEAEYTVAIKGTFTKNINEILAELGPRVLFGKPMLKVKGALKASAKGISKTVPIEHSEAFSILGNIK